MMGRSHAWTGVAGALVLTGVSGQADTAPIWGFGLAYFTSLLPDLDQHRSLASRHQINKPAHMLLRHFGHRRLTHSLLGLALFSLFIGLLASLGEAFLPGHLSLVGWTMAIAGYASHIFADMFNKQGVQLFYPFKPLGREWWSVPLPRAMRISTIHDGRSRAPLTPGRVQGNIHTEKWFWTYPVYIVIAICLWFQAPALLAGVYRDAAMLVSLLPGDLSEFALSLLF